MLTGDIHSAWGANLLDDFTDPNSDVLAAEFVCSSITSTFSFSGRDPRPLDATVRPTVKFGSPHIEFFNGLFRGYCLCEATKDEWKTTYRGVSTLADIQDADPNAIVPFADSPVETDAMLTLAAGFNAPGSGGRLVTEFARVPLH